MHYPWQKLGSDLFTLKGENYLLVTDYFSRYPEAIQLRTTTSQGIIAAPKSIFSRHGIPQTLVSDNGPQYSSQEFAEFATLYGFQHTNSSPHYPQSNGHAEHAVKTVKKLLTDSSDPFLSLLSFRSTPLPWCRLSPAELLMGRRLRTDVPQTLNQLTPQWPYLDDFRACNEEYKVKQKQDFNRRHKVRDLPDILNDTDVWITTNDRPIAGKVTSPANTPRSYHIDTPSGQLRRNRSQVNIRQESQQDPSSTQCRSPVMTRSRTGAGVIPPDRL